MKRRIHMCLSLSGALKNWDKRTWSSVAKDNNMSVSELKDEFIKMIAEGKKVIPMHEECEGFSYETGCPGHEVKE